jgi:hypothetical protein
VRELPVQPAHRVQLPGSPGGTGGGHVLRLRRRGHGRPANVAVRPAAQRWPAVLLLDAPARSRAPHPRPDRTGRRRCRSRRGAAPFQRVRHGRRGRRQRTIRFGDLPVPASGAINPEPGNQVSVIVAVHAAPACRRAQLALRYRAGGFGTGNDFGGIIISDIGPQPCRIAGRVQVTGLGADGRPVTNTVSASISPPGVLSPGAAPIPAFAAPPPGELVYYWLLAAEYRDGPPGVDHGYCQPLWVIPDAWRVSLADGTVFTVANADPPNASPMSPSGGLITCQGRLGADGTLSYLTP